VKGWGFKEWLPIILMVLGGLGVWAALDVRVAVVEVRVEGIQEDITEIKEMVHDIRDHQRNS